MSFSNPILKPAKDEKKNSFQEQACFDLINKVQAFITSDEQVNKDKNKRFNNFIDSLRGQYVSKKISLALMRAKMLHRIALEFGKTSETHISLFWGVIKFDTVSVLRQTYFEILKGNCSDYENALLDNGKNFLRHKEHFAQFYLNQKQTVEEMEAKGKKQGEKKQKKGSKVERDVDKKKKPRPAASPAGFFVTDSREEKKTTSPQSKKTISIGLTHKAVRQLSRLFNNAKPDQKFGDLKGLIEPVISQYISEELGFSCSKLQYQRHEREKRRLSPFSGNIIYHYDVSLQKADSGSRMINTLKLEFNISLTKINKKQASVLDPDSRKAFLQSGKNAFFVIGGSYLIFETRADNTPEFLRTLTENVSTARPRMA